MRYECRTCGDDLGIVGIVGHECDRVLSASDLSPSEQSTLVFIEARLVNHRWVLDLAKMNYEDRQNIKLFTAAGLLKVDYEYEGDGPRTMSSRRCDESAKVAKFTDAAWDLAGECRRLRAERMKDGPTDAPDPRGETA